MSATDPRALAVDEEQYASGEGPCLTSIRDRRVISVPDYTTDTRWPGVTAKGRQVGVYSSFSVPLEADGHVLGSYNL